MRSVAVLGLLAACGRVGFAPMADDQAADGGTTDVDAGVQPVEAVGCETRTAVAPVIAPLDQLFWIVEPGGHWIIALPHVASDDHPLHYFELGFGAGALTVVDEGVLVQTQDATAAFVPTQSGHLLVLAELSSGGLETIPIANAMPVAGRQTTPALGYSREPAARDGGGIIAAVGLNGSGEVVAMKLGSDGAFLGGTVTILAGAAEAPDFPTIIGLQSGFVAVWAANALGRCRIARLDDSLAVVANAELVTPGGGCAAPYAALFDNDRIVLAGSNAGTLTYAVHDLALAQLVAPQSITGEEPKLLADGDRAWMSWATPGAQLRHGWIDRTGALTTLPSLGTVPSGSPWSHTLGRISGVPILMWGDANTATNTIVATRLCR